MKSPDRAVGRKRASPRFSVAWITIGTLGLLTLVFLTQQAIWLSQFGTADWQRRRADLQKGAELLAIAFDEEMQRVASAYRLDEEAVQRNDWSAIARRVPAYVDDVYLVNDSALQRWDAGARTFRPVPWPARLQTIQREFRNAFDESSFSLIVPFVTTRRDLPVPHGVASPLKMMRVPMQTFRGVVITLDRDVLARSVVPDLMKRHLPADEADAPFAFVVKSRRTANVLIASERAMHEATAESSDAAVDLLAVNQMIDSTGTTMSFLPSASGAVFGVVDVSAAPRASAQAAPTSGSLALPRGAASARPPALMQMLIRHPAGSLRLAVTQARRRNLVMSVIALVLLAGSAVAMAISSHRARQLVRQQMEFVGGVTHELRTPVAVVCMTASNLADGVVKDDERVREYGQLIQAEGQRLSQMIDQILTFAGADSDTNSSSRQIVPVANLVGDVLSVLASQIAEKKFACDVRIDPDTPAVRVDAAAVRRALQNLLTNAMKYSGDSRRLEISAKPDATVSPAGAQITVRDWGIGIAADEQGDIFHPFLRGRDVAQSSIPGSGLGLSIVERIAHAHDGRVSVDSTRGEGSAFTLHLPGIERVQRAAEA